MQPVAQVAHILAHTVMARGKVLVLNRLSRKHPKAAVVLPSYLLSAEFGLPVSQNLPQKKAIFSFCLAEGQQVDIQSYCSRKLESVETICEPALLLFSGVFFSEQKL